MVQRRFTLRLAQTGCVKHFRLGRKGPIYCVLGRSELAFRGKDHYTSGLQFNKIGFDQK